MSQLVGKPIYTSVSLKEIADLGRLTIGIVCYKCNRNGRVSVKKLMAKFGEYAVIPDMPSKVAADCQILQINSFSERCGVHLSRHTVELVQWIYKNRDHR